MLFDAGTEKSQKCCSKENYVRQFRSKNPLVFLRKVIRAFINWKFAFWQTSTLLSSKTCRSEIIKTVDRWGRGYVFSFQRRKRFCFNQTDLIMSFRITKYESLVQVLKSSDNEMFLLMNAVVHVVVPMLIISTPHWLYKLWIYASLFGWRLSPK